MPDFKKALAFVLMACAACALLATAYDACDAAMEKQGSETHRVEAHVIPMLRRDMNNGVSLEGEAK